jgi:hypothetical protein
MSQQINLFNPAFVQRRQSFSLVTMLQGLGLILAGGAAMYGYADYQVGQLEHQVEEGSRRFNAEQLKLGGLAAEFSPQRRGEELQEEARQLERQVGEQAELLGVLESGALGNSAGYSGYMRAFSRQAVQGLWLTGFNVGGGGAQLSLSGGVTHPDLLPEYIQRLRREEVMQGKTFAALQMQQAKAEPGAAARYVEFELRSVAAEATQ